MSGARAGAGHVPGSAPAAGQPGGVAGPGSPRSKWKAVFFLLALAGIVGGVAWALLDSRFLVVRVVHVTGAGRLVSVSEVTAAAAIPPGLPLIRVDQAAVARRVERITQVQSAQVSRDWPDGVTITVQQRRPLFAVPDGGAYDLVDAFGVSVTRSARQPARMPKLSAAAPLRGNPAVHAAAAVLRELPASLARRVTAVAAPSPENVSLKLTGGVTIVWGGPERAAEKTRELAILMRRDATRYDVSGPGTAMTKG